MPAQNRILNIIHETDVSRKEHLVTALHNEIIFGGGTPLNAHERDEVCQLICAQHESRRILITLWSLALKSSCHSTLELYAEQFVREIIANRSKTAAALQATLYDFDARSLHEIYRHYAVAYVQAHNLPYFAQHFKPFILNREPYILYEVACEVGKASVFQKITMLIEFVATITTHDLAEIVTAEIMYGGTAEHLAMLREKMRTHPEKRHVYQYCAELVELGLREDRMKANAQQGET